MLSKISFSNPGNLNFNSIIIQFRSKISILTLEVIEAKLSFSLSAHKNAYFRRNPSLENLKLYFDVLVRWKISNFKLTFRKF